MGFLNIQGFRRMLVGEPTPDKNDPKYKERYEREVEAGKKFAQALRLDRLGAAFYRVTFAHKKAFFAIILSIMTFFVIANFYRFYSHANSVGTQKSNAVGIQDSVFRKTIINRHKTYEHREFKETDKVKQ